MAVAAPILPPAPAELDLPDEVKAELRSAWAQWWEPLRAELRAHPPDHDSGAERLALARFARGLVALTTKYGASLRPLLRMGFSHAFEELVAQEEAGTPTIRRLGLKFVGRAVEMLGEVYEAAIAFAPPNLPVEALTQLLPDSDEAMATLLDRPSVAILRLELYTFVAFDLVREDPLDEFLAWARRAHGAAQSAAPYVAHLGAIARASAATELSPDVLLTASAFDRVIELVENPPVPSARLRQLVRRGAS